MSYDSVVKTVCSMLEKELDVKIQIEKEYKFLKNRKFRFDYALIVYEQIDIITLETEKIAIEIEGGVWISGRHNIPVGFIRDMEKYNLAIISGWKLLRYTPQKLSENLYQDLKKIILR